jgi:hypothetical protein
MDRIPALSGIAKEFLRVLNGSARMGPTINSKPFAGQDLSSTKDYVSGMWLRDIHYSLMWEPREDLKCHRLAGLPTWSWASLLAPVTWTEIEARRKLDSSQVRNSLEVLRLHRQDGSVRQPKTVAVSTEDTSPPWDTTEVTTTLLVRANIQPVLVGAFFCGRPDWETQHESDTHRFLKPVGTKRFRAVYHPDVLGRPSGWGRFEHPDLQDDGVTAVADGSLRALHVSTMEDGLPGAPHGLTPDDFTGTLDVLTTDDFTGALDVSAVEAFNSALSSGLRSATRKAYNVLFVKELEGMRYQRIGMGLLWGVEMDSAFENGEKQPLELV